MSNDDVKVISHGCRLNIAEGETIKKYGDKIGLKNTIIINSCAVTNRALKNNFKTIKTQRQNNPHKKIIVTGCAVQTDFELFNKDKNINMIIDNHAKKDPDIWNNVLQGKKTTPYYDPAKTNEKLTKQNNLPLVLKKHSIIVNPAISYSKIRTIVEIQNGCDHQCSFCIIPIGRGRSISYDGQKIIDSIKKLVEQGSKEIVLSGVDISSYHTEVTGFNNLGDLVEKILLQVPKLFRLRLSSIDGSEIDDKLFYLLTEHPTITPYIHLSLQAGNDMILKRMKRRHTRKQIITLCHKMLQKRPDIAFGADLIAGFPTETNAMFTDTLNLIEECNLVHCHIFPFSARNQAVASSMPQVENNIIFNRAKILRKKALTNKINFAKKLHNHQETAIIENCGGVRLGNFFLSQKITNFNEQKLNNFKGNLAKVLIQYISNDNISAKLI